MATDAQYYRLAARMFADFSGTIAIPAVLAALAGKWLDTRYATEPRYLMVLLVLALGATALVVVRKARRYKIAYDRLNHSSSNLRPPTPNLP